VLVDAATSLFDPAEIAVATSSFVAHSRLRRLVPELSVNLAARRNYTRLRELLRADGLPATVLVVGGGDGGAGIAALGGDGITLVTSDIQLGGATDLVADAHRLPFADGTFDAVVAQAVLEHVVDPWRCVEELHRVLRPDGLVYAETPFMQQVHMAPYDFTRFTPLGHRRLFRRFAELDTGAAVGAGSALAWSLAYFVAGFGRSPRSRRLLYAAGCVLFAWVRNFDRVLRTDAALDAAAGCYFLGRRSERVLSDRELITRYRGGVDVGGERS
jgi:SAM-dependent methyltransferase